MIQVLVLFMFFLPGFIHAQQVFDKYRDNEMVLIAKLVEAAQRNNPQISVYANRIELARENNTQAKWSWFNNVNLSYQYVPNYGGAEQSSGLPKFGLGLSVNLGNILSTPSRITQTESEIAIAEADFKTNQQYLKAETIRRYANFKRATELLKTRDQAVNDSESTMLLVKHRFEQGEATLEDYNRALRAYTDNKERKIESMGDILAHKYSLEEIIGISLEELE